MNTAAESGAVSQTRYVLINRLVIPVGGFLLLIIIGRHSDVLLGQYVLMTTFYFAMQVFPILGLSQFLMREVARHPADAGRYYATIGFISVIGCLVVDAGVVVLLQQVEYQQDLETAILVVGILIVPGILAFIAECMLITIRRARAVAMLSVTENLLRLILSVAVLWFNGGIIELTLVLLITRFCAWMVYLLILSRVGVKGHISMPDWSLLYRTLRIVPPFLLATILLILMSRLDFFLLSLLENVQAVGYYAISYRLFEFGMVVTGAVVTTAYPWISKLYTRGAARFRAAIGTFMVFFAISLWPMALAGTLLCELYVKWLFPMQHPEAVLLAELFTLLLVIAGVDALAGAILNGSDRQVDEVRAMLLGSGVFVVLLLTLIPVFGVYGAFISYGCAVLTSGIARIAFLVHRGAIRLPARGQWQLAMCFIMFWGLALLIWLLPSWLHLLGWTVLSTLVLPGCVLVTGVIRPLRLLRYFRQARSPLPGEATLAGLADRVARDARHQNYFARQQASGRVRDGGRGLAAVVLFRLSRYLLLSTHYRCASLIAYLNRTLLGVHIELDSQAGPGLVLVCSGSIAIRGVIGSDVIFLGGAQLGTTGPVEVGDRVIVEAGAIVAGPACIAARTRITAK